MGGKKRSIALIEYFQSMCHFFHSDQYLGHQRSLKGKFSGLPYFFRKYAIISEPIIGRKPRKKAIGSSFEALSLSCHQN